MFTLENIDKLFLPFTFLAISVTIGVLLELFLRVKLKNIVTKNNWVRGGQILKAFRGITFVIFLGIGIDIFVNNLPIDDSLGKYISRSLTVMLILATTVLVSRIAVAYISYDADKDKREFQGTSIITNIIRIIIFCIGVVAILHTVGISITPMLTALGVGGLAVALALQDTLSNLFAGIFLIASHKLRIGDYIKLQSNEEGFVEDISWRTTTIRETSDTIVVVPNSKLSTAIFKNYYLPDKEMSFGVQLAISYNNDMHLVEKICIEAALRIVEQLPNCVKTQVPSVRFTTFTDVKLQFSVGFRITEANNKGIVRHEFIKEVMKAFRENGVQV
jgi:small-conductance mechanosensitive channel